MPISPPVPELRLSTTIHGQTLNFVPLFTRSEQAQWTPRIVASGEGRGFHVWNVIGVKSVATAMIRVAGVWGRRYAVSTKPMGMNARQEAILQRVPVAALRSSPRPV